MDTVEIIIQETSVIEVATGIVGEPGKDGASKWAEIDGVPSAFPPEDHTHPQSEVEGLEAALAEKVDSTDPRLSDTRDPKPHTHFSSDVVDFAEAVLAYLQTRSVGGVLAGNILIPGFFAPMVTEAGLDGQKGAALGLATLGADGKHPTSQIPQALLGATKFIGFWDADANATTPDSGPLPPASAANKGRYWIVSNPGETDLDGISEWALGDWAISLGTQWGKVDNTDAVISVNGKIGIVVITKADVGLGNADDTPDLAKPISTATQTALDLKAPTADLTAHTGRTDNPHSVTKAQVGLGNAENTLDLAKPISTAAQTALDGKAVLRLTTNTQAGTTYSAVTADLNSKVIVCTSATAVSVTVPVDATLGSVENDTLIIYQAGAGQVSVTVSGTSRAPLGAKSAGQYCTLVLRRTANASEWAIGGQTAF